MDINTLTPYVGDALCILALHYGSHIALRRYIAVAQLIPPARPPVDPTTSADENVSERPNLFRRIFNKRVWRATRIQLFQIPFIVLLVYIIPKYGTRQMLDIVWSSMLFFMMVGMIGTSIFWLLPSNVAVQLKYNVIAKACLPKVDEGPSFFTRRNMGIMTAASAIAGSIVASSAYGVTVLQGVYAASFVLGLMSNAIFPRYTTKKVLKGMALMVVVPFAVVGLLLDLLAIAMKIWPDTDEPASGPEELPATPSPWVNSLMTVFMLGYSALYVSVIVALSLRFDYVEEFGVPTRRSTGPVPVPQRLDQNFAMPTYRAGMVAQVVSTVVFRLVVHVMSGPQEMVSILSVFFTTPAVAIACLISAKSTGRLKRFLDYEEIWVPTEDEADKMGVVEPEKEALLTSDNQAAEE